MFNCTVSNATLSPKSSMATPDQTRSLIGHRTLSTRLPMVVMSRASESLVGAWDNSCKVRGRLPLLLMARAKSSKACSINNRSRLTAEYFFHQFFLRVEGRGSPECPAPWRRWRFHPEPLMTFSSFMNTNPYHLEPPSHRAGSWIQ